MYAQIKWKYGIIMMLNLNQLESKLQFIFEWRRRMAFDDFWCFGKLVSRDAGGEYNTGSYPINWTPAAFGRGIVVLFTKGLKVSR